MGGNQREDGEGMGRRREGMEWGEGRERMGRRRESEDGEGGLGGVGRWSLSFHDALYPIWRTAGLIGIQIS